VYVSLFYDNTYVWCTIFPDLEMSNIILDEGKLRDLPFRHRLDKCTLIIKNEIDESLRWDAVWLAGEIAELNPNTSLFDEVAELMVWVLKNDDNGVVKHEACYQIAARNMRNKIPDLIETALNDTSVIAKHEAIESLGLMRAFDSKDLLLNAMDDPDPNVKETAAFVLKRLSRLAKLETKNKEYRPSSII
jgi:HEAT repeat protein